MIINTTKADNKNVVVTVIGEGEYRYCRKPCPECPWKKDATIGAFPAEAFRISAHTAYDMAQTAFGCHMRGKDRPTTCAGFILKGSIHNLNTRIQLIQKRLDLSQVKSDVPLYESYREMAEANGVSPNDSILKPCR